MEHPEVFEPGDPIVQRVREICLRFPEAVELPSWGRPSFRVGKDFRCDRHEPGAAALPRFQV